MTTKVLITGSSGYIGKNLTEYLLKKSFEVHAIGLNRPKIKNNKFFFYKKNLLKDIKFELKNIQCLIHTAAISPQKKIRDNKIYFYNITSTRNIINFAKKNKITNIIFLSSISIYGEIKKKIINEKTNVSKPTMYGLSKLKSEKIIKKEKKINSISLRLPGVIGYKSKRNLLSNYINFKKKIIKIFNPKEMFNNTIHVDKLCEFISSLISKINFKGHSTLVLSTDEPIRFIDIIKFLFPNKQIIIEKDIKKQSFIINNKLAKKKFYFRPGKTLNAIKKFKLENKIN